MSERKDVLGFEPQKEIPYNTLLPYSNKLDEESNEQLVIIKTNLARTVQLRDIKIGASHWTGQLAKYIRLHGHKFSKEDHICFVKLLFELTTIPDLTFSLVQKFAQILITLLKKRDLLSREDLELPWRPLYKLLQDVVYSQYDYHGLILYPSNIEGVLKHLVRVCRIYFPLEASAEMLEEWRPLLCPFDMSMLRGMYFLELFLPTTLPEEHHDKGFKLWFEEFMNLYLCCQNCPSWEGNLVHLFSRLAIDAIGYVEWDSYLPQIFTRILRSFSLPVGNGSIHIGSANNCYEVSSVVCWIAGMLGGGSKCQEHLSKMLKALESFYHPSNVGKWNNKLHKLMCKLPQSVTKRIHRERYKKTWLPSVRDSHKLTNEEITEFVKSMKPVVFLAMFSKVGSHDSAACFQQLAVLRPEIIIPPLLERTYPALETLTEPHRLVACLQCVVAVARPLIGNHRWFPEGRSHVIPLLNHCLPGIDPNDIKKCLTTFQLISTVVSIVPLVDCSGAIHCRNDLTEEEIELCSASAQFEDFVLQFIDRILSLIEMSSQEQTRTDSSAAQRMSHEESMVEVGLLSTFNAIVQQSSEKIYDEILNRLFRFATTSVFEVRVAGKFTADLVRAAVKVNPEKALKKFVMHFCDNIKSRTTSEDFNSNEEHLDKEFLWNMNLLSECVRCDGKALLPYIPELKVVLRSTLHLKCKEAANLSGNLLRHILKATSLTYPLDYRSSQENWNQPLSEFLPIRAWGQAGDIRSLDLLWHEASEEEREVIASLLEMFLLPELDAINAHSAGTQTITDREELHRSLCIVLHCLVGSGILLKPLQGDIYPLVESMVDLTRFDNIAGVDEQVVTLRNSNVRTMVANSMRGLVTHMLDNTEDDTKSLNVIVKIYQCLLFFQGTQKEDFDARWKSLHLVKKSMENKLQGKKNHIRALLVDRVQLQHELRVINHSAKNFTMSHKDVYDDLYKLATSRYISVRQASQHALNQGFYLYAYSYKCKVDDIVAYLREDPSVEEHHFKGALYLIYGENKRSIVTKRSWETMLKVWPALIQAKHSEKPSLLKLIDNIADKLHNSIETTELKVIVHQKLLDSAQHLLKNGSSPAALTGQVTDQELLQGQEQEALRNKGYHENYEKLASELINILETGNLRWKFHLMGLEMLGLLLRHDVTFPAAAVRLFVKNTINENIQIRKISIMATSAALKVQKRKHPLEEIDPHELGGVDRTEGTLQIGDRPDNTWHHFQDILPWTPEKWNSVTFVEKTHWGYYTWPKVMKTYSKSQPDLDRQLDDLSEEEKPIYEHFSDAKFLEQLLRFLSLEENKGKDHFHSKYFVLFKGLFRNFGDKFLPLLKPHIERMVADTSPETHESNHRCAAEIIAGLIRGYKHWPFEKVQALWEWLSPVLKTAVSNITVESVKDWGTCFATSSESRDPKKIAPLLEFLLDNPLRGEGGSFGDSSRLYLFQGAFAQQEWRVPQLLHKFLDYASHHLSHSYQNVRDRLGSVLVNLFLYDISLPNVTRTTSPRKSDFVQRIMPQLECLTKPQHLNGNGKSQSAENTEAMEVSAVTGTSPADIQLQEVAVDRQPEAATSCEENDERKAAIRLFKTMMKWLQGNFSRMFQCVFPEIFSFLPLICQLKSELTDEELRHDCILTGAFLAKVLLSETLIPIVLDTVKKVAAMPQWHARAAILAYLQVMVFNNLFLVQESEIRNQIQDIVLGLLCDDQLEVRELAAMTLGGFLHCGYIKMDGDLMAHFEKLCSTKITKKNKKRLENLKPELLIQRHAGVLGLSACVQAYPYDVPEFMPQILMDLSDHLDDPQPIQMTVKKTLSNFKRTHHDNWQDHKQKFTDDQLVVLTELLVSPNYYA